LFAGTAPMIKEHGVLCEVRIEASCIHVLVLSSTYLFRVDVEGFYFSLDHTQTHATFSRAPLDEGSARRRDLYLTTQTLYKRQTSILPVGFEPTIPASARPQTYALDRAATGIGSFMYNIL
jgi:hypothetical protein